MAQRLSLSSGPWYIHKDLHLQPTGISTYRFGYGDTVIHKHYPMQIRDSSQFIMQTWLRKQVTSSLILTSLHKSSLTCDSRHFSAQWALNTGFLSGLISQSCTGFTFVFGRQLANMSVYSVGPANMSSGGFKRVPICGFEPHPKVKGLGM